MRLLWLAPPTPSPSRPVESQLNAKTLDRQVAIASHNRIVDDVVAVERIVPASREMPVWKEVLEELIPILQAFEGHTDVLFPFQERLL